jgi:hypothetical protein
MFTDAHYNSKSDPDRYAQSNTYAAASPDASPSPVVRPAFI